MIFNLRWRDSIRNIIVKHKIPTMQHLLLIKELACIMHKYYNKVLPPSIHSLFPKVTHRMTKRSGNKVAGNNFKTTLSQQTITYRATHLWTLIPNEIKFIENPNINCTEKVTRPITQFKDLLDEYLYKKSRYI